MAIWIVLPILTLLMFDLGLSLRFDDFGKIFRSPWPIFVALFGQLVLLPLIALGLATVFKLSPVFFIGLVLITVFYIQHHKTILDNIGILGLCVTALILVAIGCSSLLSRLVKTGGSFSR